MNKERFNYLNKFQQLSQNQDENQQESSFRNEVNQIPSSKANFQSQQSFQRILIQKAQNFENFGTFNNELHHEQTNYQQFESIRPQVELGQEPAFSKISQSPSQYSQIIHENNLIEQRNISDLSTQQKLLINKRKSILEGFSRVKTSENKQSFIQENNKNQNDTFLQDQLSRMTEKKSYVVNDNQRQQSQNNCKSFFIRDNQIEKYGQSSFKHSKTSNIKNEHKISVSQINPTASFTHFEQNNQCKSLTSSHSRHCEQKNSSNYVSNSSQNLQKMKNFIENKSQQVKDLQAYLVKQFQEIQNQKQKHRYLCLQMNQMLKIIGLTQNQHHKYKNIIQSELKQFQRVAMTNIESLAKKFAKELFKVKIQSDEKSQTIKEKQLYIQELQKKVKTQQQKISDLQKRLLEKKEKVQIQPQVNKSNEIQNNIKFDILSNSTKKKEKQQIVLQSQNQKSHKKFQRSKSKNNRYDYFKHFQKQMSQQLINQKSSRIHEFKHYDSPSKLQDDYDHRLQRLLQQVQERQNMVKGKTNSNLKFSNSSYNKNEYLLIKNNLSPLKQSNNQTYLKKISSPRSPSNFSPAINKSMSISNINQQKFINRRQENIQNQSKQIYHDRKKYIKDKIERIKSMKQNQKTIEISKYQQKEYKIQNNNYGFTKTPPRGNKGFDYSSSKNPIHIKSTYVLCQDRVLQNQQTDLSHSYSQAKMGSSFNRPKTRHSNVVYQYPDRSGKNKASIGLAQYSRGEDRLTPSKVSSVYMMGINTKNVTRF